MGSQYPNEPQKGGPSSQQGGKQPQPGQPQQGQQGQQGSKQPSQQARDSHTNSSRAGDGRASEGTDMPSDIRPDHPDGAEPDRAGRSGQQQPPQSGNR